MLRLTNQRESLRQQRSFPVDHHGEFSTLLVFCKSLFILWDVAKIGSSTRVLEDDISYPLVQETSFYSTRVDEPLFIK